MSIGEKDSRFCQSVDVGCLYVFSSVTFQIAVAEIVGVDKYNVGFFDFVGVVFSGALLAAVAAQATEDTMVRMKGCFIGFGG